MRSGAQMISYEISIGLIIISVILSSQSMNLSEIILGQGGGFWEWNFVYHFPMFIVFIISMLAETNRAPFDLPEAEAELVAGYNVDYSAMTFALFFLGEYANMILMSALCVVLFLGGWHAPLPFLEFIPGVLWFIVKICAVLFIFLWVRATFPRYRYDQLMRLGWKVFLPFSFAWVMVVAAVLKLTGQV